MAKDDSKAELGEKRLCPECNSKFYDLTRRPAVCPICGFSYDPDTIETPAIADVLKPEMEPEEPDTGRDEEDIDEEEMDEEEAAAKELELDGDDAAIIGSSDEDQDGPNLDGFQTDEDEDEDAALVDDDGDDLPPTGDDDDDPEEIEI